MASLRPSAIVRLLLRAVLCGGQHQPPESHRLGDLANYVIAMRQRLNVEPVPPLFDATNQRPTASRAFFAWGRWGADVTVRTGRGLLHQLLDLRVRHARRPGALGVPYPGWRCRPRQSAGQ
jgi:hypothetical protein